MNYSVLKNEISSPDYSGLSDQQVAASLNIQDIPAYKKVEYSDVASYLMLVEKYLAISDSALPSAKSFMLAMNTFETFDLNKPGVLTAVVNLFDAMIIDGLINSSDKAAILALADDFVSRADVLGLPYVRAGDVEHARKI